MVNAIKRYTRGTADSACDPESRLIGRHGLNGIVAIA
jgi:hypothetical protein